MLSNTTIYGYTELERWVIMLLFSLNGITFIITVSNVWYLLKTLPKIENREWDSNNKVISNIEQDEYRRSIEKYFYFIAIIPLFVSFTCHYGARFPGESIWIFPGMNIIIAIAYLLFIRMMIISCDGWITIQHRFIQQQDRCASCQGRKIYEKCCKTCCCKLFLRENAYLGLKQRVWFCFLIMLKPLVNYASAYFEYDYGSEYQRKYFQFLVRTLTICTTFIPKQNMVSFHQTLLPYTRLRNSTRKRKFVSFLAPICQIQQGLVGLLFNAIGDVNWFGDIHDKYDWVVGYGILLCIEMLIFSIFITRYAFDPKDLRLWTYSESMIQPELRSSEEHNDNFLYENANATSNKKSVN